YKEVAEQTAWMAAAVQTGWENLGDTVKYVALSTVSGVVTAFEDLKLFITDTMPTTMKWFYENWRDIWKDVGNMVRVVGQNMMDNLGEIVAGVMAFLRGNPQDFEFKALTDGFESSLRSLP